MKRIAWYPPGTESTLTAVLIPPGEVTEHQWWEALADRVTELVMAEPDPEQARRWANRAMAMVIPGAAEEPQDAGQVYVQHNLELMTALNIDLGNAETEFPLTASEDEVAREALEQTDLATWVDLMLARLSPSSLD